MLSGVLSTLKWYARSLLLTSLQLLNRPLSVTDSQHAGLPPGMVGWSVPNLARLSLLTRRDLGM